MSEEIQRNTIDFNDWEIDAMIKILNNGTYTGSDLEQVVDLKKKILKFKKE